MMQLQKRTRYALYAAMSMAQAPADHPVTAAQVAERFGVPAAVLAKAFQQLVRAGIAVGTRGLGGGYRLSRRPSQLTLLDVIEVFESPRGAGQCLLDDSASAPCSAPTACSLRRVFDEIDDLARNTLASITVETLVRPRRHGHSTSARP